MLKLEPPPEIAENNAEGATDAAATDSTEGAPAAESTTGPITIALTELNVTVSNALSKGLTPLIVDPSENHVVDTFYQYNGVMIDAKQLSLNVSLKKMTKEEALEKARNGFVSALQQGSTMIVSMQQGSPSFNEWFNTTSEWPLEAIATKGGKPLTIASNDKSNSEFGNGIPNAVMRENDKLKYSGFAIVQDKFEVVFTTWFEPEDFEEFLFDEGRALCNLSKDLFQIIIITT